MRIVQFLRRWGRIAGPVLAAIPRSVLVLFTDGETTGGDPYGLQHLIEAVPLAPVTYMAWRLPRVGGLRLAGISALLGVGGFVATNGQVSPNVAVGTALVAGLLFWVGEHFTVVGRGLRPT